MTVAELIEKLQQVSNKSLQVYKFADCDHWLVEDPIQENFSEGPVVGI